MAAINFPSSPSINQVHTEAGVSWIWTGTTWDIVPTGGTNPISGSGTANYVPKFTSASDIGNSTIQDLTTGVLVSPSVTASGAIARGLNHTPSLTAAANNDVLVGLDINPTFTNGAFTGVRNIGIRTTGDFVFNSPVTVTHYNGYNFGAQMYCNGYEYYHILRQTTKVFGISVWNGTAGSILATDQKFLIAPTTTTNWNLTFIGNTGASADLSFVTTSGTTGRIFGTGNWFIGASPVDSGFKLDVNGLVNFTGTTASDGGQLGAELLSAAGWTSTGWTGSFGAGWTHTVGNTTALTNTLAAVNGNYYQITYTVTGRTAGTFVIAFGGYTSGSLSATGNVGPRATSTGTLSITPTTDFDGTIVISIKVITAGSATVTIKNSSGTVINEINGSWNNSNTFIGVNAGANNQQVSNNTFIGSQAGEFNTTGSHNTYIGRLSGNLSTLANQNVYIGSLSGQNNLTGSNSVFIGYQSGFTNNSGGANSFIGYRSGFNNTGSNNSFLGADSGFSNTTGSTNTFLGSTSGFNNTTGSNNVAVGLNAGRFISSGANLTVANTSVFIGRDTRGNADSESNQIAIGDSAIGLGSNTTVIGNSSTTHGRWWGNLLIGTSTNSGHALDVIGTARISNYLYVSGGNGSGLASATLNTSLFLWNRRTSTSGDGISIDDFNEVNGTNVNINNLNFVSNSGVKIAGTSTLNIIAISKTYDLAVSTTSSSIIRGFYYNPTITNLRVAQHRAIETVTGDIYFASTSGSVGIGVLPSATYKLDVNGTARIQDNLTISDAKNIILDTTTGTKIGTATTQKLSFWNAAPVSQPNTGIAEATFVENSGGTAVNVDSTFAGYTLQQIAQALKDMGILA